MRRGASAGCRHQEYHLTPSCTMGPPGGSRGTPTPGPDLQQAQLRDNRNEGDHSTGVAPTAFHPHQNLDRKAIRFRVLRELSMSLGMVGRTQPRSNDSVQNFVPGPLPLMVVEALLPGLWLSSVHTQCKTNGKTNISHNELHHMSYLTNAKPQVGNP